MSNSGFAIELSTGKTVRRAERQAAEQSMLFHMSRHDGKCSGVLREINPDGTNGRLLLTVIREA